MTVILEIVFIMEINNMHFIGITKAEDNFCEFGFSDAYITMEKDFDTAIKNANEKYAKMDGIENITVMTLTHNTDFSSLLNLVDDAEAFINCAKQIAKHCEWSPLFMGEHNAYLVVEKSNDGVVGGEFIVARTKPEALEEFTDGYLYRREGEAHKVTPQSLVKKLSEVQFYNTYNILADALDYLQLKKGK